MKIAFISYEFPPETGGGGIGTYLALTIKRLNELGHLAIVFCGTNKEKVFQEGRNIVRVPATDWIDFDMKVVDVFTSYHENHKFDIIEGTDFQGCGISVKKLFPHIPLIVKSHTPLYLVDMLSYQPLSFLSKVRFILGAFKRFRIPKLNHKPHKKTYAREFEIIALAERISCPSISIFNKLKFLGFAVEDKSDIIPLPFDIVERIRLISSKKTLNTGISIVYIGRLEKRKGVLDLANAIPKVLKQYPNAVFTFVGEPGTSPKPNIAMDIFIKRKLKKFEDNLIFTGKLAPQQVIDFLEMGDIFVFPSHYESFGMVCCEAMAAGKAIIGSDEGGMAEILNFGECGLLIKPKYSNEIAAKINLLIEKNHLRLSLGAKARERVEFFYRSEKILKLQIESYTTTIKNMANGR